MIIKEEAIISKYNEINNLKNKILQLNDNHNLLNGKHNN
jgi:hypothetical protein